jgi:antitoxin component of MazEF toxin-antitoxin module
MSRIRISAENKVSSDTIALSPKHRKMLKELLEHYNTSKSKYFQELIYQEYQKISNMVD